MSVPTQISLPTGCMGVQPSQVRGPCAFGCDIRPGSWDLIVGDVVLAASGVHVVRPLFIGKIRDEADALYVARQYRCRFGVVDTRPETTLAKRMQDSAAKNNIKVWRAEYNTAPSTYEMQENTAEQVVKLDRTMTLDNVHYAFQLGVGVMLPQNFREITGGDFAREMCSSARIPTRWMGKDCWAWEHSGPDHSFHAFNYLLVAIKLGKLISFGGNEVMGASRGITVTRADAVKARLRPGQQKEVNWDDDLDDENGTYLEV